MDSQWVKIRKDVSRLEEAIDSFSPRTKTEKKVGIELITRITESLNWAYSPKDFYSYHDITKSEAKYLAELLGNCHKKLGDERFPKTGELEYEDFIKKRAELGSIIFNIQDLLRHEHWFKNDEVRLPKAQRILNRKEEIEKLELQISQTQRPGACLTPLITGVALALFSLRGNNAIILIIGLLAIVYSVILAIKGSMIKEPHEVLQKKIAKLKEEIDAIR